MIRNWPAKKTVTILVSFPSEAGWDVLEGESPLQTPVPPGKLERLLLFEQAEGPADMASPVDSKLVQNVPVAQVSCH